MIHNLLLRLHDNLPFHPPIVVAAAGMAVIALALWIYGRSRSTVLFSLAIVLLAIGLVVGLVGLERASPPGDWGALEDAAESIVGPPTFRAYEQITAAAVLLGCGLFYVVYHLSFQEKPGERPRRLLEQDAEQIKALGSAHLCPRDTFKRWSRHDPQGWTLRGKFYGVKGARLGSQFSLSGEDIARGVAVFGPQGSGKTQTVILPAIADRMRDGHSLIVTDVQGELQSYIRLIAATTGHLVIVHNPSSPEDSCRINLCDWIHNVADAQAMAAVLLSGNREQGDNAFWRKAGANLLAACALHYGSFGRILDMRRRDLHQMARDLQHSRVPGVADLAANFASSMATRDPRLALNIQATAFESGLDRWAESALREITECTDVDLPYQMSRRPTVVVLRCAEQHEKTYGAYLGTILRVLTTRLSDIGQQAGGRLSIPVGLILEEFPALGRLDSLVRDINLFRKRRISVLTAAQSMAQFDSIYPAKGEADQLLAGLATKIVFGGCDQRTADFFSRLSGQQTIALASLSRAQGRPGATFHDTGSASLRGRPLLLPDNIIRPDRGHATLFAAYSEGGRADQAIFHGELTPFFKRKDWKLDCVHPKKPLVLSRPTPTPTGQSLEPQPVSPPDRTQDLKQAIVEADISRQKRSP